VPEFLSEEWLRDLDAAVRAAPHPSTSDPIEIEQVVSGVPRRGEVRYRIVADENGARVINGDDCGHAADVRLTTDYPTAAAIAAGRENAQFALAAGRLRLRGNVDALLRHAATVDALGAATSALRGVTTFPPP
jgi:hypothetical protein